jgi:hypothetical protein
MLTPTEITRLTAQARSDDLLRLTARAPLGQAPRSTHIGAQRPMLRALARRLRPA